MPIDQCLTQTTSQTLLTGDGNQHRQLGVLSSQWNDFIKLLHWRFRERYRRGGRIIIKTRGNGWLHGNRVYIPSRTDRCINSETLGQHVQDLNRLKPGRFPAQRRALRHGFQPLFVIAAFWQRESQFSLMEYTGYYLPYSRVGPVTRSRSS